MPFAFFNGPVGIDLTREELEAMAAVNEKLDLDELDTVSGGSFIDDITDCPLGQAVKEFVQDVKDYFNAPPAKPAPVLIPVSACKNHVWKHSYSIEHNNDDCPTIRTVYVFHCEKCGKRRDEEKFRAR